MTYVLKFNEFLLEYLDVDVEKVKQKLSKEKFKHSKRVGELVKLIDPDKDLYTAAVYHDFLERGGSVIDLQKLFGNRIIELVMCLTDNKTMTDDTLTNIKQKLSNKSSDIINDVLTIKLCDRADNLKKREYKNDLSKKYLKKSAELIQYIWNTYSGDNKEKMRNFIHNNILPYIPSIEKDLKIN
jgi:(p)ppGpp synthase/HD superfamily hydrolase